MQGSRKELVESWDDVRDRFNDLLKRPVHRYAWHRDILERYKEGRLCLHLHVALHGRTRCYLIARENETRRLGLKVEEQWPGIELHDGAFELADGEDRRLVFVVVYDEMEPAQRVIRSTVSLGEVDRVLRECRHINTGGVVARHALRQTIKTIPVALITDVDGEMSKSSVIEPRLNVNRIPIALNELPNDVIQSGAQIRDAITDDGAEPERRIVRNDMREFKRRSHRVHGWIYAAESIARYRFYLTEDLVRLVLEVHPDFGLETVEVLLGPDDFEPGTV